MQPICVEVPKWMKMVLPSGTVGKVLAATTGSVLSVAVFEQEKREG